MKKPNRVMSFLFSLIGQSWAYDEVEEVREVIATRSFDSLPERAEIHSKGAASLTDSLAFQPGLVDLHDELHDTWVYLASLKGRAREMGYASLAGHLEAAADSTRDVMEQVASAAEATVPAPQVPLTR
ncbi:hypothetical protein [Streptomyces swartbergensis]|uniref:Uncharacterized protein n=1 Tax=Streptomyces swartbergensis TaxID=487165 RepID=A0A243S646_9ACTN|nr:hypothetical protein [Streptomyces swartbergensis]OUD03028.1 hypothetical protein CA983_11900 [Streptomyces swartbergensis]